MEVDGDTYIVAPERGVEVPDREEERGELEDEAERE